jgi:transcription elongation factor Elf1
MNELPNKGLIITKYFKNKGVKKDYKYPLTFKSTICDDVRYAKSFNERLAKQMTEVICKEYHKIVKGKKGIICFDDPIVVDYMFGIRMCPYCLESFDYEINGNHLKQARWCYENSDTIGFIRKEKVLMHTPFAENYMSVLTEQEVGNLKALEKKKYLSEEEITLKYKAIKYRYNVKVCSFTKKVYIGLTKLPPLFKHYSEDGIIRCNCSSDSIAFVSVYILIMEGRKPMISRAELICDHCGRMDRLHPTITAFETSNREISLGYRVIYAEDIYCRDNKLTLRTKTEGAEKTYDVDLCCALCNKTTLYFKTPISVNARDKFKAEIVCKTCGLQFPLIVDETLKNRLDKPKYIFEKTDEVHEFKAKGYEFRLKFR